MVRIKQTKSSWGYRWVWPILWALSVAVLAGASLVGCATESLPEDQATLTLRDYLGLSPERLGALTQAQRAHLRAELHNAWTSAAAEPTQHVHLPRAQAPAETGLQWPLRFVQALDQDRAERAQNPIPIATLTANPNSTDDANIAPAPVLPQDLGLTLTPTPSLSPDAPNAPNPPKLHFDTAWPTVDDPSLGGRSQRALVEEFSPLLHRFLAQLSVSEADIQVVPAPRAPLLLWYVPAHRALMLNPALLYLLAEVPAPATPKPQATTLVTRQNPLELDFINTCVSEQRSRCALCLEASTPEDIASLCTPLYYEPGETPSQTARAECERLIGPGDDVYRVGDLVKLQCYNNFATTYATCMGGSLWERCGLNRIPATDLDVLWMLKPMLNDERCQYALQSCYDRDVHPVLTPVDPPPPDPTNPPPSEPYLPPAVDDTSDDCSGFSDACVASCQIASTCSDDADNGSPETGEGACESSDSSSSSSSDSCEGDSTSSSDSSSSLCEGGDDDDDDDDDNEESSSALPTRPLRGSFPRDGLLVLSLVWLGLAWYRDMRRQNPPPSHPPDLVVSETPAERTHCDV